MTEFEAETSVLLNIIRISIIVVALPAYFLLIILTALITLPLNLFNPLMNKLLRTKNTFTSGNPHAKQKGIIPNQYKL